MTTTAITSKQVSASVRKTLGKLADRGGTLKYDDGTEITLPAGLGFAIRAAMHGVGITIEDRGYVDRVTGGDREKITEFSAERDAIVAEVDKIRTAYQPPLGGTTKWGAIIISARATTSHREGTGISGADHYNPPLYCANCRTEILRGEPKHQVIGRTSGQADTLCGTCNQREMYS
jgi:hypothetical protein